MITLYNIDKEIYYQVYICLIDIDGYLEDEDITSRFFNCSNFSFDNQRKAYYITNKDWELAKKVMEEFIITDDKYRTYNEDRYYEIEVATPYYKVYDKWGEWCNEGTFDDLSDVKREFIDTILNEANQYSLIPYAAEECGFKSRIRRWGGEL